MAVLVTLDVFSGRPNPTWELNDNQIKDLIEQIDSNSNYSLEKQPNIIKGLGYRGFRLESLGEKFLPELTLINSNLIDLGRENFSLLTSGNSLEKWLLDSGKEELETEEGLIVEVSDMISNPENDIKNFQLKELMKDELLAEPRYNPGWWNNNSSRRRSNNCYNYGNNKATNTFAQPGRGSGRKYSSLICDNVGSASERDGLRKISNPNQTPSSGHFVALAIWPGRDYHWWRRDNNRYWSHKPGGTNARDVDNSGRKIRDPRNCNRGPYSAFCGYYHTIPSRIRIR